jgi:beta-lactamase regulating signal transducer with metallopeptidase domain
MFLLIGPGLLFVLLTNIVMLAIMRRISDWSLRRTLQFAVLLMPLVMLGLGLCSFGLSFHALFPDGALFVVMGGIALGALGLGMVRLALMSRLLARCALFADTELQMLADNLAGQYRVQPRIRLYPSARPLALTCGLRTSTIMLSTWMVEQLDQRELEGVLAHELEHVTRHDYLVMWLATMLRDAFFYLPTSWIAFRQLQQEKELACDDGVVDVTQRPLALASALTKVWLQAVDQPALTTRLEGVQALTGAEASMNERIKRLLAPSPSQRNRQHTHWVVCSLNAAVLLPFGVFEGACLFLLALSTVIGCHPIALCGRL